MEPQRVSTGVPGLDSQLIGGFIKGRSYVVLGDAGTGKTTARLQFLLSGLKQGEKGLSSPSMNDLRKSSSPQHLWDGILKPTLKIKAW